MGVKNHDGSAFVSASGAKPELFFGKTIFQTLHVTLTFCVLIKVAAVSHW